MEEDITCDIYPKLNQDRTLVLIEYPGIVKNADKMLKTLGGEKNISGTYGEENTRIDLRFRPDDPTCHAVCGDRTEVNALLLNVKKYRHKKTANETSPDEFRYRPEIVGVIDTAYKFNALCDFQYLPLHNDVKNDKLVNMIPYLKVEDIDDSTYTKDVPLFLPPATFSRFDQQNDVLFRKAPRYKKFDVNPNKISIMRPRRSHFAQYLKFEEDWTPKEPLPAAREVFQKINKTEDALVIGVKKLFDQRPIWSKNAITFLLQCNHERLKNVLPAVAYYFITGPWRSLWVKFGYDPRKNSNAAKYQLLDFRVRQGLNTPHIPIKAKRSTLSYRLPNLMPRSKLGTSNLVNNLDERSSGSGLASKKHSESVYVYRPGILPAYRQTFYQICDIFHPSIVEIVEDQTDFPKDCNVKSGWYPTDMASKIRDILSHDIQKTISNTAGYGQQILNMERAARKKFNVKVPHNPDAFEEPAFEDLNLDSSSDEEKLSMDDEEDGDFVSEPEEDSQSENEDEILDDVELNEEEEISLNNDHESGDSANFVNLNEPYFDDDVEDLSNFLDDFENYSSNAFDNNGEAEV